MQVRDLVDDSLMVRQGKTRKRIRIMLTDESGAESSIYQGLRGKSFPKLEEKEHCFCWIFGCLSGVVSETIYAFWHMLMFYVGSSDTGESGNTPKTIGKKRRRKFQTQKQRPALLARCSRESWTA